MKIFERLRRGSEDSLAELYLLPVAMAALSVTMWLSLPTLQEALARLGEPIRRRHEAIARFTHQLQNPLSIGATGCTETVEPPLYFDNKESTNAEIIGAKDLREINIDNTLNQDLDLFFTGKLQTVLFWYENKIDSRHRWTRKQILASLEQPLSYRYLVLYGTEMAQPLVQRPDRSAAGSVKLRAYVFDFQTDSRICQVAFHETIDPDFRAPNDYEGHMYSQLGSQARERLLSELARISSRPAPVRNN